MKVLAINGSPRKRGNTEILLDSVLEGVKLADSGAAIEIVRLNDLNINPCIGCGGCDKTGRCVVEDDMIPLYDKIVSAKRIILASPIYFYGITAQAKAFVDRCQALWSRKRLPDADKNNSWFTDPDRKGYLVSVAATQGSKVFDGAILTMKYGFEAMGVDYGGDFLVKGADKRGDIKKFTEKLTKAVEFGKQCVA